MEICVATTPAFSRLVEQNLFFGGRRIKHACVLHSAAGGDTYDAQDAPERLLGGFSGTTPHFNPGMEFFAIPSSCPRSAAPSLNRGSHAPAPRPSCSHTEQAHLMYAFEDVG